MAAVEGEEGGEWKSGCRRLLGERGRLDVMGQSKRMGFDGNC